jgi:hypothetical protein
VRVILAFADGVPPAEKPVKLHAAERALKERVDPELAVYLEEMRDSNVIRRLTKPKDREERR